MTEEFGGDLAGAEFWGADLRGATFRDVDLTGVRISHARVVDVEIDADVQRLVVNGVDVTAYVNERDPWHPLRSLLRPEVTSLEASWAALDAAWAELVAEASALPEEVLHESVAGEWSFVQTVRHLVFAIDKWFTVPILGGSFAPMGMPNSGSVDFGWPGLDPAVEPSAAEALAVHAERRAAFGRHLPQVTESDLDRPVEVLENGVEPLRECLFTVFEETFWHLRYARRDLAVLTPTPES